MAEKKFSPDNLGECMKRIIGLALQGGNVGGGVQYWFAERIGWRAEFREYIFPEGAVFITCDLV